MVHGWNCEFESDMQKILASKPSKQSAGSSSLNDMLKGFFEFYSTFEFNRPEQPIIISTSKGEVTTGETALSKVTAVFNMLKKFASLSSFGVSRLTIQAPLVSGQKPGAAAACAVVGGCAI